MGVVGGVAGLKKQSEELELMAQQLDHGQFRSLMFVYLVFAGLGVVCSFLWRAYNPSPSSVDGTTGQYLHIFSTKTQEYPLSEVAGLLQGTRCEEVEAKAKVVPDSLRASMTTKLPYQFEQSVRNESVLQQCRMVKVG